MRNLLGLGAVLAALAGCAAPQQPNADAETLARVAYRHPGPPALTLYTMINNRTGRGGHTSLMINASERVIFDPAGSFYASVVPERDDVIHGITPAVEKAYRGAHARSTYHVVVQRIEVTPQQAQKAYQLAISNGRVPGAFCAQATIGILQQVPGVVTERYYENDSGDLQAGLAKSDAALSAASE